MHCTSPGESPLIGEAAEGESVRNGQIYANDGVATGGGVTTMWLWRRAAAQQERVDKQVGNRPQYVGNLLASAKGAISITGNINSNSDVDFYMLEISQNDIVGSMNGGNASGSLRYGLRRWLEPARYIPQYLP